MNLSDLQNKEVIDIATGRRIGAIIDVIINANGTISELVLENKRLAKSFFNTSKEEIHLEWKQIVKIGDDIILIDIGKEANYHS